MRRKDERMPRPDGAQDRDPKKSEILIVRLSHEAKQAFMEACRRDQRSASDVVRGLVDRYAARRMEGRLRVTAKEFAMFLSNLSTPARVAAATAAGALGAVALAVAPSTAGGDEKAAFQSMDANADGLVTLSEFYASGGMNADGAATVETRAQVLAGTLAGLKAETGADVGDAATAEKIAAKINAEFKHVGEKMRLLFNEVDSDDDGAWSLDEFKRMKADAGASFRRKPTEAEAEKLKLAKEAYELRKLQPADED